MVPKPRGSGNAATGNRAGSVLGPPVILAASTQVASITELRTEINVLSNPNPVGTSSELVDYAMLEAPDGTRLRIRTLYDTGATDCILDWKLAKFFHNTEIVELKNKGIHSTQNSATHIGTLKIIRADGTQIWVKAMK